MAKKTLLITSLVLYLVTAGASYAIFNTVKSSANPVSPRPDTENTAPTPRVKSKLDPNLPKTEICPLNGSLFTKQEKEVWSSRRPLAVMIENSVDARPQSGLGSADVVYEAVAEGGITRFMGIFYCEAALTDNLMFAPVRSARIYFVNLLGEYDALYNHVGGAGNCDDPNVNPKAKALCLIDQAKVKNMDQMGYAGDFKTCHRVTDRTGKDVAYEHTMACFADGLYAKAEKLGWTNVDTKGISWDNNFVPWKYLSAGEKSDGSPATSVSYMFWEANRDFNHAFDVSWKYDPSTDSYLRSNGGEPSIDLNTNQPLRFKTVVVQYTKESFANDLEKHMLYDVIGTGKALVFQNGVAQNATWSKANRTGRTIFKNSSGKEIKFNPGAMWVSIIPSANTVEYN